MSSVTSSSRPKTDFNEQEDAESARQEKKEEDAAAKAEANEQRELDNADTATNDAKTAKDQGPLDESAIDPCTNELKIGKVDTLGPNIDGLKLVKKPPLDAGRVLTELSSMDQEQAQVQEEFNEATRQSADAMRHVRHAQKALTSRLQQKWRDKVAAELDLEAEGSLANTFKVLHQQRQQLEEKMRLVKNAFLGWDGADDAVSVE